MSWISTNRMTDPDHSALWHKDAIIYEVHIRAFKDSNGDGKGDINGLIEKLDYVCDLGVTAIWLLPFYPSPLRDGGYDIADYTAIHSSYGTKRDFARLLREAHRRGLRVITELVLNHTSSEHPWFERARRAPKGSKARNFYVWADSPARYEDARIIFKDFETSNWSWDPVAKQYYWHRFYAHQPDLNFENPDVHEALFEVVDFWLEMGVDGLRLDAVPYLYEREGTSCENLPETHAFLKKLRAHIDSKFEDRILLAEANQWPADAAAYFGDGDECHMNFHFPLMPRMFMAVELEDSFPIINILEQTPALPEPCQWATFLRNHDELTLEMVTDEDRDTMYRAYAADHAARLNLGIRRRLAPLLGIRQKQELLTSLLLALPGTPVLYYGDEIGMGDNIYLGDRDGVRTPMQWSSGKNAGFSEANPQKLYLPTIIDPEFHCEAINVEAQQGNPSSLLWWTKRIIAKRKEHKLFGRGSLSFVTGDNGRVLAFVREWKGEVMLVVANLSRFVQCVHLNLERFADMVPMEVFGRVRFPAIGKDPYFLSLSPHGYYWLSLKARRPVAPIAAGPPELETSGDWIQGVSRDELAQAILEYAAHRRWFRGKSRARKGASIVDLVPLARGMSPAAVVFLSVEYDDGSPETYVVPVAFADDRDPDPPAPGAVIARLHEKAADGAQPRSGVLFDALLDPAWDAALLNAIGSRRGLTGERGHLASITYKALRDLPHDANLAPRPGSAEQSNTSVLYGDKLTLKVFRMIEAGLNADYEIGRFFSQQTVFRSAARLAAALEYRAPGREPSTVATVFEYVPNQGDAWQMTLDSLVRFFDRLLADRVPPEAARDPEAPARIGPYLARVRILAQRTAEMHVALSRETKDPAFAPEPYDVVHQQSLYQSAQGLLARTVAKLQKKLSALGPGEHELAERLIAREDELDKLLARVTARRIDVERIRLHGDYHLGQVLFTGEDFVIIDFEGEPGRPLAHRRFKRCALRDVAGMVRSFHYASASALRSGRLRAEDVPLLAGWAQGWARWVSEEFVRTYLEHTQGTDLAPAEPEVRSMLLDFFVLEKGIYEIGYELDNRPTWLSIPLHGVLAFLGADEPPAVTP
jgi:maltose alpha-D-glucosyltransferase/alpha-amylase